MNVLPVIFELLVPAGQRGYCFSSGVVQGPGAPEGKRKSERGLTTCSQVALRSHRNRSGNSERQEKDQRWEDGVFDGSSQEKSSGLPSPRGGREYSGRDGSLAITDVGVLTLPLALQTLRKSLDISQCLSKTKR